MPETPADEIAYKRAYAKVAAAKGLTKEAAVKIYGFESGGNGPYDIQAGREYSRKAKVISTALGYNQLLTTNTVGLLAEDGDDFLAALSEKHAAADSERKAALADKIAKLKKMIAFARTVPNDWNAHGRLAGTPKGIGVHALNLDIDVGPLLQTRKLTTSVDFAKRKGYDRAAHRRRAGDDEPDRRRQRLRHADHAGGAAPEGADVELLPARRL